MGSSDTESIVYVYNRLTVVLVQKLHKEYCNGCMLLNFCSQCSNMLIVKNAITVNVVMLF